MVTTQNPRAEQENGCGPRIAVSPPHPLRHPGPRAGQPIDRRSSSRARDGDSGPRLLTRRAASRGEYRDGEIRKDGNRGSAADTPELQRVNAPPASSTAPTSSWSSPTVGFSTRCAPLAAQLDMHLADRRALAAWASASENFRPRRNR